MNFFPAASEIYFFDGESTKIRPPRPPSRFQGTALRQGKGKGGEIGRRRGGERGKGAMGKGKREGREGKRGGRDREGGKGGLSLRHWRWGG